MFTPMILIYSVAAASSNSSPLPVPPQAKVHWPIGCCLRLHSPLRQNAECVRELAPKLDLREDIALLGEDIQSAIDAESLAAWGSAPPVPFPAFLRIASLLIALAALDCS